MPEPENMLEQEPTKEKGANVSVRMKFIRHGERTKTSELTDYGREVTRKKAKESGLKGEGFDAVKPYGSQQGPKADVEALPGSRVGMARALETAYIYTEEVRAEDKKYTARSKGLLNFETLKIKAPYEHVPVYNSNLPENYDSLSEADKAEAAKRAQSATVNHLLSLDTPQADQYRKETAGAFAKIVNQRIRLSERLNSGSKVLLVEGTHGPMPELLLKEALVRETVGGQKTFGFKDIDEIGGPLYPSESIDAIVERDEKGVLRKIRVELDPAKARPEGEMYLDLEKLDELEKFYDQIHKE